MTAKKALLFLVFLLCQNSWAQQDSIRKLDEVVVSDVQLRRFSDTQQVMKLNDSVIKNNRASLTSLLNYNSVIYFKENGPGMVSSASFRGTTAQQTAVIWNGININSAFTGQTDFNTINTTDFNSIAVRSGGGSVIYGSSAIGGSVHLNSELVFGRRFENEFRTDYGSFNTLGIRYGLRAGTENLAAQIRFSRNSSSNDFDFPGGSNKNGQYYNTSLNADFGYRINRSNYLKFYSYFFDGERHFSLISPSDTQTKYRDSNARNLLEWTYESGQFTSTAKVAFLSEKYWYFANLAHEPHNYGRAETAIAKYDAAYEFPSKIVLNGVVDFTRTKGTGTDIGDNERNIGSAVLLVKQQLKRLAYELGLRKEITDTYESPLLFSAGLSYKFTENYTLKGNASRNFRIPDFNDLFWLEGSNPDLKPESSYQFEVGNEFRFKKLSFSVTGYLNNITDMIQWLPGTTTIWFPRNINNVRTYGIEAVAGWNRKIGTHEIALNGTYAYTVSENAKTGYQLIYVPYHKATGSAAWSWKRFSLIYQTLFNGTVFTQSDNNPRYNIDSYWVSNINASLALGKANRCKFGAGIQNIFNENYRVVEGRPFPGRNYNMYLTINL